MTRLCVSQETFVEKKEKSSKILRARQAGGWEGFPSIRPKAQSLLREGTGSQLGSGSHLPGCVMGVTHSVPERSTTPHAQLDTVWFF